MKVLSNDFNTELTCTQLNPCDSAPLKKTDVSIIEVIIIGDTCNYLHQICAVGDLKNSIIKVV